MTASITKKQISVKVSVFDIYCSAPPLTIQFAWSKPQNGAVEVTTFRDIH